MENSKMLLKYLINKSYFNKMKNRKKIKYLQFYITNKCTESCEHCYLKNTKIQKELTTKEVISKIEEFLEYCQKTNKIPIIDLIGGDPFLRLDIKNILRYLKLKKINFGIKGNPNLLPQNINLLVEYGARRYQLSLDGTEEIHDRIRSKGSFKKTIESIKLLNDVNIPVNIKFTLSSENETELWKLLYYLYTQNLKISSFSISRYHNSEFLKNSYNKKKFEKFFDDFISELESFYKLQAKNKRINILINFKEHLWYPYLHQNGYILEEIYSEIEKNSYTLSCSLISCDSIFLKSDGTYIVCPKIDNFKGSKIFSEYKERKKAYLKNVIEKSCVNCLYKKSCMGCLAFYNNFKDIACFLHSTLKEFVKM
ncbi:hypothetical protein FSDG_01122 [Fusobacterium animalis 7_1]|jgi:hypothetical protein|uniref:Radical SAM core domain-containing protein n=1 Tax=Fusobacterium animalis 7_1 TaxID=457405 RepID=A0A140PVA0_9FUSO|nr:MULTISPECIES: radical SAM protein [Fusobacterium]EEO42563.1 hypothetical protein FSDG_01122 [Fusobacterium animalis 7_1]EPC07852.1 hypothetical protein HMPREF9369_02661 [Fusobacterium polymorphum F0401]